MPQTDLSAKQILMVVAPENFRDEELFEPQAVFERAGAVVVVASTRAGMATGTQGGTTEATLSLSDVQVDDYDAIVVVGGNGAPAHLWGDETLHTLLQKAAVAGKVLGAICLAGVVLARAGLLAGRRATVYMTRESLLEYQQAGVRASRDPIVIDGHFVTAIGPHVAREFGEAVAVQLAS
ncbi:MAG: DJ-1/PfpI family protein [Blastocatellia bacterium]|jgi:protease I